MNEQTMEQLLGELAAIKAFCSALVMTHPDPKSLQSAMDQVTERMTASFLAHPDLPEATLDGMRNVSTIIKSAIADQVLKLG